MKPPRSRLRMAGVVGLAAATVLLLVSRVGSDLAASGAGQVLARGDAPSGQAELVKVTTGPPKQAYARLEAEPPQISEEEQQRLEEALKRTHLPGPPLWQAPQQEPLRDPVQVPQTDPPSGSGLEVLAGPAPTFTRTTNLRSSIPSNSTSTTGEPSVANSGSYVFQTGNWYAALSSNGGQSFAFVDPLTTFPASYGGFCCDQEVLYEPNHDMMIWELMYIPNYYSNNEIRLAVAKGVTSLANGSWYYYDFTPQDLGYASGYWYDYPHMAFSNNYLYISANVFYYDDSWASSVLLRIPLDDLAVGASLTYDSYSSTTRFSFGLVQGASTTIYWGSTAGASIRLYKLAETSNVIFYYDVSVSNDPSSGFSAIGPDGRDWAGKSDNRVLAGWVANGVIGFMWNAPKGTVGSVTYPYPFVHVARFAESTMSLINEPNLWSQSAAWLYPSVSVNRSGHIAGSVAFGGGSFYPSLAVFIWDNLSAVPPPWDIFPVASGNSGPIENRWGDYLASRPHDPDRSGWIATGYTLLGGGSRSNVQPWFLYFGRSSSSASTPTPTSSATPTSTPSPTRTPTPIGTPARLAYGMNVLSVRDGQGPIGTYSSALARTKAAGFDWVLTQVKWTWLEPSKGNYNWITVDDIVEQSLAYGLYTVLRIDTTPQWASGSTNPKAPPTNPSDFGDFMAALVNHMGNRVAGYIILNEPNLAREWGGQTPNATAYMELLRQAFLRAKAANLNATIISAALAPTNDNSPLAIDDRIFLQSMYDNGLKDYSDVIGVNALGFTYSPDDTSDPNGFNFSRVKQLRDIIVANGDANSQAWALETGWLRDTSYDLGLQYNWMKVSEVDRARYLVRAYEKAYNEWPWMGVMFIWNLDFGIGRIPPPAFETEPEKAYFGLLEGNVSPYNNVSELPSYAAVKEMSKPPATYTPTPTSTPMTVYLPITLKNYAASW